MLQSVYDGTIIRGGQGNSIKCTICGTQIVSLKWHTTYEDIYEEEGISLSESVTILRGCTSYTLTVAVDTSSISLQELVVTCTADYSIANISGNSQTADFNFTVVGRLYYILEMSIALMAGIAHININNSASPLVQHFFSDTSSPTGPTAIAIPSSDTLASGSKMSVTVEAYSSVELTPIAVVVTKDGVPSGGFVQTQLSDQGEKVHWKNVIGSSKKATSWLLKSECRPVHPIPIGFSGSFSAH